MSTTKVGVVVGFLASSLVDPVSALQMDTATTTPPAEPQEFLPPAFEVGDWVLYSGRNHSDVEIGIIQCLDGKYGIARIDQSTGNPGVNDPIDNELIFIPVNTVEEWKTFWEQKPLKYSPSQVRQAFQNEKLIPFMKQNLPLKLEIGSWVLIRREESRKLTRHHKGMQKWFNKRESNYENCIGVVSGVFLRSYRIDLIDQATGQKILIDEKPLIIYKKHLEDLIAIPNQQVDQWKTRVWNNSELSKDPKNPSEWGVSTEFQSKYLKKQEWINTRVGPYSHLDPLVHLVAAPSRVLLTTCARHLGFDLYTLGRHSKSF